MNCYVLSVMCAGFITACGPKYGIPEKQTDWPRQTTYAFQIVQKGQVSQRGAIENKDILDLSFNADCVVQQNKQTCTISGPIQFYENDSTGKRTLQTEQKIDVPIQLYWKGRTLRKVDVTEDEPFVY